MLGCEISDFEFQVVVRALGDFIPINDVAHGKWSLRNFNFAKVELTVDKLMAVGKVHGGDELDSRIVDHFDVLDGDPILEVQLIDAGVLAVHESLNLRVHVSTVIGFNKLEIQRSVFVFELFNASHNIRMSYHINPD